MYKIMALISLLIRQFLVPNPFEALGEGLTISAYDVPILLSPTVLNVIAEPIVHTVTFTVVGLYYHRGEGAEKGSFLYLLFYLIHTFVLWLMASAGFEVWAIVLILLLYIGIQVLLLIKRNSMI